MTLGSKLRGTRVAANLTRRSFAAFSFATALVPTAVNAQQSATALAFRLLDSTAIDRADIVSEIQASGDTGLVAPMIDLIRYYQAESPLIGQALDSLTGEQIGTNWYTWRLWQQGHPEIEPFSDYAAFKGDLLSRVDENFGEFISEKDTNKIRLEEIVWGGVRKDGIPALVSATMLEPESVANLTPDELVFGLSINGDARAYPLRILDWHEMANDVVGGVPIALAYCTLCGSGIVFDTRKTEGGHFEFGSSGLLYRSNKLMYDRGTNSLWNQFTGKPVVGELAESDIELPVLPVTITSWDSWQRHNPTTKVLSPETGHQRNYTPGAAYGNYFASPNLMFPARLDNATLAAKEFVFALRIRDQEKAWPLSLFEGGKMIHDQVGDLPILLIGNAATRTVSAYERGNHRFEPTEDGKLVSGNESFIFGTEALIGAKGEKLARLPGHIAYWFAYQNYLPGAPLATPG